MVHTISRIAMVYRNSANRQAISSPPKLEKLCLKKNLRPTNLTKHGMSWKTTLLTTAQTGSCCAIRLVGGSTLKPRLCQSRKFRRRNKYNLWAVGAPIQARSRIHVCEPKPEAT